MEHLTFNLSKAVTRWDTLHNKKHLVVPMVMITHGVHAGSDGPMYYPDAELAHYPEVWNMKPVVVYHPTKADGTPVTATDKNVAEARQVGVIMNTKYVEGKLKAEAWLDVDALNRVDARVLNRIETNQPTEVSTGLSVIKEVKQGEYGGKQYGVIAHNMKPDHLAILVDQEGACSMKDGAGLLVNKGKTPETELEAIVASAVANAFSLKERQMDKKQMVDGLIANSGGKWTEDDRVVLMGSDDALLAKMVANAGPPPFMKKKGAADPDAADEDAEAEAEAAKGKKKAPVANSTDTAPAAQPTLESYYASLPPVIANQMKLGLAQFAANQAKIVGEILALPGCVLNKAQLEAMPSEILQATHQTLVAAQPAQPVVNAGWGQGYNTAPLFHAGAGAPAQGSGQTNNSAGGGAPLVPYTI